MTPSTAISFCALFISALALLSSWGIWRRTHRPIVTVSVETVSASSEGTALKLVVRNIGNRPAKDVQLTVDADTLNPMLVKDATDPLTVGVRRCFTPESTIPLLLPTVSIECSFGFLARGKPQSTWREQTNLPIRFCYRDLETNQMFRRNVNLRIADNTSFTGSMWGKTTVSTS